MVDKIREGWPEWLSVPAMLAILQMLGMLIFVTIWFNTKAITTDNTAMALSGVNSRLDRVFTALDIIRETMPVIQLKISNLEGQVSEARGSYNTMRDHLEALDHNEAANHFDASKALGRKP